MEFSRGVLGKKTKSVTLCKMCHLLIQSSLTLCPHLPSQHYLLEPLPNSPLPESVLAEPPIVQNQPLAQKSSRTSVSVKICIWQLETEPRNNSGSNKINVYFSFL